MSEILRVLILVAAISFIFFIFRQLRRLKIKMEDTIFWIFFTGLLTIMSVVPEVSFFFSTVLGIQSPANLAYLVIIFLLIEKLFTVSMKLSLLEEKLSVLTAEVAIRCKDIENESKRDPE